MKYIVVSDGAPIFVRSGCPLIVRAESAYERQVAERMGRLVEWEEWKRMRG